MTGSSGERDARLPRSAEAPAPSAVEDLLRATLDARAADVDWNPAIVVAAVDGPVVLRVRRVPRTVAWLSAAAAAVLVVGGVSVVAGGGSGATRPGPGSSPAFTVAVSPTQVFRERFATCEEAWSRGALAFVTPSLPPFRSFDPVAVTPAATSYQAPLPTSSPGGSSPVDSSPVDPSSVDPSPGAAASGVSQSSAAAAGDLPAPRAEVTTITPGTEPTAGSQRYARTPAEEAAWNVLTLVLDEARFAGFSVGPERDTVTVHVVRGTTAAQAQALVASCALDGVQVRSDLVDWSQSQLMASAIAAMDVIGGSTGGVDIDANRGLVTIDGTLTLQQRQTLSELYGSSVEVYSYRTGELWRPASP